MVASNVENQGKTDTELKLMSVVKKSPKSSLFKQLKLIPEQNNPKRSERTWDKKRIRDLLYFIGTYRQFTCRELRKFCKVNGLHTSGKKELVIKRIWDAGFEFEEVYEFINQITFASQEEVKVMYLTERIQLKITPHLHELFRLSRDLFNRANQLIHQSKHMFVLTKGGTQKADKRITFSDLDRELRDTPEYRALPAKTSQQIIQQVDQAWTSFFLAIKAWKEDENRPEGARKFTSRPKPPGCRADKPENLLYFNYQQCKIKCDETTQKTFLHFPKAVQIPPIQVDEDRISGDLYQVRVLPRDHYCIVDIVYKHKFQAKDVDESRILALDLGVRNIVCMVNNIPGLRPIVVRGGVVKSINSYYNKRRADLLKKYSALGIQGTPKKVAELTRKRNNKIEDVFHKLSLGLIEYCKSHKIGRIIIGYNPQWKQKCSMGKRNNQNFVTIPFYHLLQKIEYKAELASIKVELVEESHTSKCSFLDEEPIEHHDTYLGQRGVYRSKKAGGHGKVSYGLFKTAKGQLINADVNGGYNILRKAFPKFSKDGIEGLELVPIAVKFSKRDQDFTQLKHLANLNSPTHALPKAAQADGREIGGVSTGNSSSKSINLLY